MYLPEGLVHPLSLWCVCTLDGIPLSPDAVRNLQACPFCQRTYHLGASLREHIKFCHERDGGHIVCPVCGYTPRYRAQMEQHMALHSQVEDKVRHWKKYKIIILESIYYKVALFFMVF